MLEATPRIAIFIGSFGGGGVERVIAHLAQGFIQRGLKVDLVVDKLEESHLWRLPPDVRIVNLKAPRLYMSLPNLVRYLRREQPVALLSASHYMNEVALLAKLLSRVSVRVVVSEHNHLSQTVQNAVRLKDRLTPFFARYLYPLADGILAVSQGVAEDLARMTGLSLERIKVIYNPVVTPKLLESVKQPVDHPWFAPGEPPVILGVGKLEKQKDFPNLIRAFAQVRQVRPARLMILGWGPDRPELEALVQELNLEDDVVLAGYVENPYAYMAKAAVFVLSSAWEGLPTVLIEAMAVGIPVVSTDCKSGPSEILDNGKYGELTPVGDNQVLAEAILRALSGESKPIVADWLDQFKLEAATQKYLDILGVA